MAWKNKAFKIQSQKKLLIQEHNIKYFCACVDKKDSKLIFSNYGRIPNKQHWNKIAAEIFVLSIKLNTLYSL